MAKLKDDLVEFELQVRAKEGRTTIYWVHLIHESDPGLKPQPNAEGEMIPTACCTVWDYCIVNLLQLVETTVRHGTPTFWSNLEGSVKMTFSAVGQPHGLHLGETKAWIDYKREIAAFRKDPSQIYTY